MNPTSAMPAPHEARPRRRAARWWRALAVAGLLLAWLPASAQSALQVLDALRRDGFASPADAVRRLQAAPDRPGAAAPVDRQREYLAALAGYAVQGDLAAVVEPSLRALDTLATRAHCRPCAADAALVRTHWALSQEDLPGALRQVGKAAQLADARDPAMQLKLHLARARVYDQQGTLTRALAEAVQALSLADRLGAHSDRARLMTMMVGLNADLGDFKRAERMADEAYELARRTDFRYVMAQLRLQQGYLYGLSERPGQQEKVLRDALRITQRDPDLAMVEVICLANLADYFLTTGDNHEALRFATRADAVAQRLRDDNARSISIANQGIALARLGRTAEGVAALRRAIAMAQSLGANGYVVSMQEELATIFEKAGRPADALEAMRAVVAVTRQTTQQEREKAVLELQEKYSAERRSREIERLTAANRVNRAEVAARTWQQRLWAAVAVALALALVPLVQLIQRARRANRQLSGDIAVLAEQSSHDALTGAYNRRYCETLLAERPRADAGGRAGARVTGLMLLDVDFFKHVNDQYGHAAGDAVLVEVSRRLQALLRKEDAVVRWGGEEFVLVLPGTPAEALPGLARRVLATLSDAPVHAAAHDIPITVSLGCTAYPAAGAARWEDALHLADMALYMAKTGGRNRASCVLRIAPDADAARLASDLAGAVHAGDVALETVVGNGDATRVHAAAQAPAHA